MTRIRARRSTRSRCLGRGESGGRTRITTRWSHSAMNGWGCRPPVRRRIPARVPGLDVQPRVRRVALTPGSGAGRAVGVDRGAARGTARGALRRRRSRPAANHGNPQKDARVSADGRRLRMRSSGCGCTSASSARRCPVGDDPLWWTMRRAFRPLTYHATRAMFAGPGPGWTPPGPSQPSPHRRLPDGSRSRSCRRPMSSGSSGMPTCRPHI